MWEFLTELLKTHGLLAVVEAVQVVLICYFIKQNRVKDDQLRELADKRLEDVKESKEDYEDLVKDVNKSLDMLIRVLNKH